MNFSFYRPKTLDEFVGQEDIKYSLKIYIDSAISNKKTLDHILINGASGVGKTTLAKIVASSTGNNITFVQGSNLAKISDLLNLFSLINENEIIFIDEIHKIDKSIIEMLYVMMEDFVIDIPLGANNNSKISRLELPKFTLIAATNFLSKLPNPLIDRFPIKFYLSNYTDDEIYLILKNVNDKNNLGVSDDDLLYIANISKQNPRIAINLLKRYYDYFIIQSEQLDIKSIFKKIGYYEQGLNKMDIEYLKLLNENKALSLTSISQNLGFDKQTIETNIENYLIKIKFVEICSKGRKITTIGQNYLLNNLNKK